MLLPVRRISRVRRMHASFVLGQSPVKTAAANHFFIVVESKHFDHTPASNTSIQNPDRVDSDVYINQFEFNRWNRRKPNSPVFSNRRFPAQYATRVYLSLNDERRGHLKV